MYSNRKCWAMTVDACMEDLHSIARSKSSCSRVQLGLAKLLPNLDSLCAHSEPALYIHADSPCIIFI